MITRLFVAIGLFFVSFSPLAAQDWPQILGPDRNGVADQETLFETWPNDGLKRIWKKTVGQGYAGPVVQDDSVVIFHRIGKEQICERLDAQTGEEIWKVAFPANYAGGGVDADLGPKAVPLIQDGNVILYGPSGNLYCLNFEDGSTRWTKSALKDYRGREGYFGAGSTPIVTDNRVIVNIGGNDAGLVAFDLNDGSEIWKAVSDQASYSSPILSADKSTVIAITRFKAVGVNVADGQLKFEIPFGKRGPTVNAAMPVLLGNRLFLTASYNVGARWIQLSDEMDNPQRIWANDESYSSQYSTPVHKDGYFYGTAGREDFNDGSFRCLEAATGKVQWTEEMPVGHSILVGDKIIHIDCKSVLRIIPVNAEKFTLDFQAELFPVPSRCIPAISRGRLFVRSNAFGPKGQLACFAIGPKADTTEK